MTTKKPSSNNLSAINAADNNKWRDLRAMRCAELDAEYARQSRKLQHLVERLKRRGLGRIK